MYIVLEGEKLSYSSDQITFMWHFSLQSIHNNSISNWNTLKVTQKLEKMVVSWEKRKSDVIRLFHIYFIQKKKSLGSNVE